MVALWLALLPRSNSTSARGVSVWSLHALPVSASGYSHSPKGFNLLVILNCSYGPIIA